MASAFKRTDDRKRDIAAIHAAASKLGMDTADKNPQSEYRTMLQNHGGAFSTTTMSAEGRRRVMVHLRSRAPGGKSMSQAQFIALLWSQLGAMGALDDPSQTGLNAFVLKTTRVQTARFLPAKEGNQVLEALKAWIARAKAKGTAKEAAKA